MADSWVPLFLAFSWCVYGQQNDDCIKWVLKEESPEATPNKVYCRFNKENNTINAEAPNSCLNSTVFSELNELSQNTNFLEEDFVTLSLMSNNTLYNIKLEKKKDNVDKNNPTNCSCRFWCKEKAVKCLTCSPKQEDVIWDKITFTLVSVAVVVGVFVFLFATFRKKIIKTWKLKNDSTECTKKTCTDNTQDKAQVDPDSSSGTYSLPRTQIEVGRCYRPLRQSVTNTTATHFQLQPSIHRPFEDENEEETYTKIADDDIDCDPGHQTHHNAISRQVCGVTQSFLETECGQGDSDGGDYNRLNRQNHRDKPSDCAPAAEENYRHFRCPTRPPEARLSDGYELAKTATVAHVCVNKIKETPAHDNPSDDHISQDNNTNTDRYITSLDHISDKHTTPDGSLDNNTPHHQTFHDYAVSEEASHNNPSHESDSPRHTFHDDTLHYKAAPDPTPLDNPPDDKRREEVSRILPCPHHENISAVITAENSDNIHEPLQQAAQSQPAYLGK